MPAGTNHEERGRDPWPAVMLAAEVAAYLRVSYATVMKMTHAGELHAIRVGREFRYLRSELDAMMRRPAHPGHHGHHTDDSPDHAVDDGQDAPTAR